MRVLVAVAGFHGLSSGQLGRRVAAGWAAAATSVVPVGEAGGAFLDAWAERWNAEVAVAPGSPGAQLASAGRVAAGAWRPVPGAAHRTRPDSSEPLGLLLGDLLDASAETVLVDLVAPGVGDAGAGLLGALGATADVSLRGGVSDLAGLSRLDLAPAHARLGGRALVGVVPHGEHQAVLGGLRGITARRVARPEADPAELLATDASLSRLAELAGVDPHATGSGACGGVGTAVLALGGELRTGPSVALGDLAQGGPYDLVITGGPRFDFASRGGGVVAELARAAQDWLAPCLVVAGEVVIGAREMRTMGVEAAYELPPAALTEVAGRIARSWTW